MLVSLIHVKPLTDRCDQWQSGDAKHMEFISNVSSGEFEHPELVIFCTAKPSFTVQNILKHGTSVALSLEHDFTFRCGEFEAFFRCQEVGPKPCNLAHKLP